MNRTVTDPHASAPYPDIRYPDVWDAASFFLRSNALKALRALKDSSRPAGYPSYDRDPLPAIIAQTSTPLRYVQRAEERSFEEGKIHNLALACARIDGLTIEPADEFSFWRAIGRPSKSRGFVTGREIREGCLIPTIGGGLCQLSGSLYSVALNAGFRILERHGHTRRLQDAYFEASRDATVFWNYVDLRFAADFRFQVEARLTDDELVVKLRAERPRPRARITLKADPVPEVSDCLTCGQVGCRHRTRTAAQVARRQMVISDRLSPEFHAFLRGLLQAGDLFLSPAGSVPADLVGIRVRTFPWARLRRSLVSRLTRQRKVAAAQRVMGSGMLAASYRREIAGYPGSYLFIEQESLPHLWRTGVLRGRDFCVFAHRLPAALLQDKLDSLHREHPERGSLAEFRVDAAYCEAEGQALKAADRVVSAHQEVAESIARCEKLPWATAHGPRSHQQGEGVRDALLFPAITAAREGAYEVRAAALELGMRVIAFEKNIETEDFWEGVDLSFCTPETAPWDRIRAVIHPAVFTSAPRLHLHALALGIPVLASGGCGLPPEEIVSVELDSPHGLAAAIRRLGA